MFSGQRQIICTGLNSTLIFQSNPFVILLRVLSFREQPSNPSIERTRSGSAGLAFISFWAKPALPPRAAHVKR